MPGGFGTSNGPNWAGRYYSDQFDLVFIAATTTLARRVTPVDVGGRRGVSVQYSSSESTTQLVNPGQSRRSARGGSRWHCAGIRIASVLFDLSLLGRASASPGTRKRIPRNPWT